MPVAKVAAVAAIAPRVPSPPALPGMKVARIKKKALVPTKASVIRTSVFTLAELLKRIRAIPAHRIIAIPIEGACACCIRISYRRFSLRPGDIDVTNQMPRPRAAEARRAILPARPRCKAYRRGFLPREMVSVVVSLGVGLCCASVPGRARSREEQSSGKPRGHRAFSLCCVLVRAASRRCRKPSDGF